MPLACWFQDFNADGETQVRHGWVIRARAIEIVPSDANPLRFQHRIIVEFKGYPPLDPRPEHNIFEVGVTGLEQARTREEWKNMIDEAWEFRKLLPCVAQDAENSDSILTLTMLDDSFFRCWQNKRHRGDMSYPTQAEFVEILGLTPRKFSDEYKLLMETYDLPPWPKYKRHLITTLQRAIDSQFPKSSDF